MNFYSYFSLDDESTTTPTTTDEQQTSSSTTQEETDEQLLLEIAPIKKIKVIHTVNFIPYFIALFFICLGAYSNIFRQKRVAKIIQTNV